MVRPVRAVSLVAWRARLTARWNLVAIAAIAIVATLAYVQPVFDTGWYYDDWSNAAAFHDAPSQSPAGLFTECRAFDPADRPGACLYHAGAYWVIGSHIKGYHLLSILLLAASAALLYLLLARCRMPRGLALLVALLFVLFPGSDATRLWPTAVVGQYALVLYLAAVLLGIRALQREGRSATLLHAGSILLLVLTFFTYENLVAVVALGGIFYWRAIGNLERPVILRAAVDLALAVSFVGYRFLLAPVDASSGFVVERSVGETLDRAVTIAEGAWVSWHTLFVPTTFVLVALLAGAAFAAWSFSQRRATRRGILRWMAVAGAAALVALAAVSAYVPAADLYVPQVGSLFNRLNLVAAPAYVVLFVALLGACWHALRETFGDRGAALAAGLVVLAVAVHQAAVSRDSQQAWAESWRAQGQALNGLRAAAPQIPDDASIVTFGHPIWERGFIPVFASSWDVRGAIDERTGNDPPRALPFLASVTCGARGVLLDGALLLAFRGREPVWFVNTATSEARRVRDAASCNAAATDWGPPPFWGRTISDPSL